MNGEQLHAIPAPPGERYRNDPRAAAIALGAGSSS